MEREKRYMNRRILLRLKNLEDESEQILEQLSKRPSDSLLVSRLNEIDIKIVAITHEQTIDY